MFVDHARDPVRLWGGESRANIFRNTEIIAVVLLVIEPANEEDGVVIRGLLQ